MTLKDALCSLAIFSKISHWFKNGYITGLQIKIYLIWITTNIAELLGTGIFFIIDYEVEQIKKSSS